MSFLFKNNATSTLAAGINNSQLTLVVQGGDGAKFPTPGGGDSFRATLVKSDGSFEIVDVTGVSTDTFTIVRNQEGSGAKAFTSGDRIDLRLTAAILSDIPQTEGGQLQADLNADKLDGLNSTQFLRSDQSDSLTGNLSVTGTVDGRDVSVDGSKLDGIANNANLYVHPNHSGDVSSAADGAQTVQPSAITGKPALTTGLDGADEVLVSNAGVLNRMDISVFNAYFNANLVVAANALSAHTHDGSEISDLDAADTVSGIFSLARIPTIDQAKLGAAAVGQGELKTDTQSISVSSGSGSSAALNAVASGGRFTLGSDDRVTGNPSGNEHGSSRIGGQQVKVSSATAHVWVGATHDTGSSIVENARFEYVLASPPYDMGDGEAGLFIYLMMDTGGNIVGSSIAADPPWAHNGPTDITATRIAADGKRFKLIRDISGLPPKANIRAYTEAYSNAPYIEVEITQAIKNADMNLIPKSIQRMSVGDVDVTPTLTQILLDPVSRLSHDLLALHLDKQHEEIDNILKDHVIIDNTDSGLVSPAGILVPRFRWKV